MIDPKTADLLNQAAKLVNYRDKLNKASKNVALTGLAFEFRTLDNKNSADSRTFAGHPRQRGGAPNEELNQVLHKELSEALERVAYAAERMADDLLDKLQEKG